MEIPLHYAQVSFVFSGDACPTGAMVTHGLGLPTVGASLSEVGNQVVSSVIEAEFAPIIENDSSFDKVIVKLGPVDTGPFGEFSVGLDGDAGSQGTAPQVSALVKKQTAVGGRRARGRLYWPFVMDSWSGDNGVLDSGPQDTITSIWNAYRSSLEAADYTCVVLHSQPPPPKPPVTLPAPTVITAFLCQAQVATQRRRNRR